MSELFDRHGRFVNEAAVMKFALRLAADRIGFVEPNPAVGAVVIDEDRNLLGCGAHQEFGGPHAEIHALKEAGAKARDATLFVTLEPCCHFGKTPPCTRAVIASGVRRVVVATCDPAPHVAGKGIAELRAAGIVVDVGLEEPAAKKVIAPFTKLFTRNLPWIHAKWAMSWDGKIATRTGHSQWISNARSRETVHQLRGRMDGILVGIGTALADDPRLTARPPGPRIATRIVLDSTAKLPLTSHLVRTAREVPLLICCTTAAPESRMSALRDAGAEVFVTDRDSQGQVSLQTVLEELGRRRMTNILVEGGGGILGACHDLEAIDEVHLFLAPKLIGGCDAYGPLAGVGRPRVPELPTLSRITCISLGDDFYLHGYVERD